MLLHQGVIARINMPTPIGYSPVLGLRQCLDAISQEMKAIGATILADSVLVRRLVVLGFDTLEVHDDIGMYGLKWQLKNFIAIAE